MIPILFVVIFFLAYFNGINITWNIYDFVIISMIMGFIGSILSGSKIQSAIVGGLVAPLTIIHPLLAAGWFSGLTEAKFRKVRRRDIKNLAHIESFRDLWDNNIFRILLRIRGNLPNPQFSVFGDLCGIIISHNNFISISICRDNICVQ